MGTSDDYDILAAATIVQAAAAVPILPKLATHPVLGFEFGGLQEEIQQPTTTTL
eukprot:CAMPEP_0113516700 /NCGR_PEP_ID=MMETSP0014_2-20120614/41755_1 /TAXON_ID=2857 /ORGANISM="Nitzschia sp." /LENGTH=53 /DNA_ID=CAMNT_0000413627 /DNA_START=1 /DNA_END=159 /DNA_ORIENTATION=+ /assembly_acc=CAM_ASM_000159